MAQLWWEKCKRARTSGTPAKQGRDRAPDEALPDPPASPHRRQRRTVASARPATGIRAMRAVLNARQVPKVLKRLRGLLCPLQRLTKDFSAGRLCDKVDSALAPSASD